MKKRNKNKNESMSYVNKIHRRRVIAIRSVIVFVCMLFGTQIVQAKVADINTKKDIQSSTVKLHKQKKENNSLNAQIKELKDKEYMKKYVRAKYYYSKDDEQIYAIPSGSN